VYWSVTFLIVVWILLANSDFALLRAIFLAVARSGDFPTLRALKKSSSVLYSFELKGSVISFAPVSF